MKNTRSKNDRCLLKIHNSLKTVKRANRLRILRASVNLLRVTGLA